MLRYRTLRFNRALTLVFLPIACSKTPMERLRSADPAARQPAALCENDQQIIESVLISLISDTEFNPAGPQDATFSSIGVLDRTQRIPKLPIDQMVENGGSGTLSSPALRAFLVRNQTPADLTRTKWDPRIIVVSEETVTGDSPKSRVLQDRFQEKFPGAKGWVRISLPVYVDNSTTAYTQIHFGWSIHAGLGEFCLENVDGKWRIRERKIIYYC